MPDQTTTKSDETAQAPPPQGDEDRTIGKRLASFRRSFAAKDASFFYYLAARVFSAVISIFTVKYVVAFLSRADFGLWGYLGAISSVLVPVVSLSLPAAMMRMYFDRAKEDFEGKASLITSTFLVTLGQTLVLVAGSIALYMIGLIDGLMVAYLCVLTTNAVLLAYFNYLTRVRNDYKLFFFNNVFQSLAYLGLVAWASSTAAATGGNLPVLGSDPLVAMLFFSGAPAWTLVGVNLGFYGIKKLVSLRVKRLGFAEIMALLRFSAPLTGTFFLGWVLNSSDVYLLKRLSTLTEIADYVFAVGIANTVSLITTSALTDWPRFYYAQMRDDDLDRDAVIAKRVRLFLWLHILTMAGTRLVARFAYDLLGAEDYLGGIRCIDYLVLGNFFFLAGNLFAAGIGYVKKNSLTLVTFAVPGVVNVGLNLWLLPRWGAIAAAMTTAIAFATFALVSFAIGQRYYRHTELWKVGLAFVVALLVALVPLG